MRRALLAAAVACAVAMTASCGTTVQLSGQAANPQLSGDGLSVPGPTTTGADLTAGPLVGGTIGPTSAMGAQTGTTGAGPSAVPGGVGGASTTATARGAKAPIKIGFVTTSVGNAAALGINAGSTYTDKAMLSALVAEYNAAGGVAGHKIVPVYGETDTASGNWESNFAAVCAQFTQDDKVQAVIGYVFVFLPSFESCLAKAKIPHLYGGYQPGDITDQQQFPTMMGTGHPSVDVAWLAPLVGALRTGYLTKTTKLGIIVDNCAHGDRAFKRSVEPWLKANPLNYQAVYGDCGQGSGDATSAAAFISSAQLKFAAAGVTLVYSGAVEILLFMINAQTQGYSPNYLMSVGGAALQANAPAQQMKKLHGFGWMPAVDVDTRHQPYGQTSQQKACVAKLVKRGLRPTQFNDFMAAYQACDGLELYAKALASGPADPRSVVNNVVAALPAFKGSGTYGGLVRATPQQRGGASVMREYAWVDACSCFTYRGPTYPIPTP